MNDELIQEKFKQQNETNERHNIRLNNHSKRLEQLEQRGAAVDQKIDNLCEQLKSLTTTLKWFIGLLVGSFVGFFFYAVQHNILK